MKTALVTGASGFVGSRLVRHLLAEGWTVHVLVRPDSSLDQLAPVLERIHLQRCDGSLESLRQGLRMVAPDVVFHLASLFLSEHQPEDVPRLLESNLLFGTLLVEAMCLENVHSLVNTGTGWQHYQGRDYSPVNLYAATKQAFEALLQYYVEARNLRVVTLKLFDTYGPDDPRPKLFRLLEKVAVSGIPLEMSPGEQYLDLVHVDDVARAYVLAAVHLAALPGAAQERFGVSSGRPIQLRALVDLIGEVTSRPLPIVWGAREYRQREVMQPVPLPCVPGWLPQRDLRRGIGEIFGKPHSACVGGC